MNEHARLKGALYWICVRFCVSSGIGALKEA